MKIKYAGLFLGLFITGCAHNPQVSRFTAARYAPTSEDIDIYSTGRPSRPYTEIGTVQVDDRNPEPVIALAAKAKEIGAHGLILTGQAEGRRVMVPMGGMLIGRSFTKSTGVAIRYTEAVKSEVVQ